MDEKLRPPLPHFNDGKMARFRCSASASLNWGKGYFYFSFYSVQDCSSLKVFPLLIVLNLNSLKTFPEKLYLPIGQVTDRIFCFRTIRQNILCKLSHTARSNWWPAFGLLKQQTVLTKRTNFPDKSTSRTKLWLCPGVPVHRGNNHCTPFFTNLCLAVEHC